MTPKLGEAAVELVTPVHSEPTRPEPIRARRARPPEWTPLEPESEEEPSLREYLAVIAGERKLVAAIAAAALMVGGAYAFLATPVYRADMLVQVEDRKQSGALGELSSLFSESSPAETEVEILRSRSIVGSVVDALKLELSAAPKRFPVIGAAFARLHRGREPAAAPPGLGRYGWGGERIALSRLELGPTLEEDPPFLVAGPAGTFEILSAKGARLASGAVGQVVRGDGVEIFVSELVARPGTRFNVGHLAREEVVAALQSDVRISERGKKTGILQLTLDGEDPARVGAILDALAHAYVRQNVDRRSAEAQQTLAFLETQLPSLRAEVEAAEARLEAQRASSGGVDVTLETQAAVARSADVEKAIAELMVEIGALRQRFTDAHPVLAGAKARLAQLEAARNGVEARMRKLPEAELTTARLLRDVKVSNELYLTLLDKAQELRVVKSGTIANVRVLDAAVASSRPVSPRRAAILALSLLLGLAAGVAAAFGRRALDHGIEDPEQIERMTGIPVHASIPLSPRQLEIERGDHGTVLAAETPGDIAIESVRSLRTSLQFALLDAPTRVVAITGPAPGVGKSFVTCNLAHVVAEGGKRVVVVDADLRRGHLHDTLGGDRSPGLSEVLAGDVAWQAVVRKTSSAGVDFLSTGMRPPNPSVLLEGERFGRLVAELSGAYDLVIVDTPPILAVTDAALAASRASVALCVLRAGRHPMREISAALRRFSHGGVRIDGFVLNGVELDRGLGARSAYHYQYSYE
jgi:tyrosine-protein kinase Etk/Wzc